MKFSLSHSLTLYLYFFNVPTSFPIEAITLSFNYSLTIFSVNNWLGMVFSEKKERKFPEMTCQKYLARAFIVSSPIQMTYRQDYLANLRNYRNTHNHLDCIRFWLIDWPDHKTSLCCNQWSEKIFSLKHTRFVCVCCSVYSLWRLYHFLWLG